MPDPIRSFYQHQAPDLSSITDLSHRHFRILLPRGSFFKVQDRIRDSTTLQKWLVRYRPSDVYYSTSCWLSPETLGRREKTPLSSNIFLSSDIVFDIDRSPFSHDNLENARLDTQDLLAFCAKKKFPVKYIAFSGSKGFHVICEDPHHYDCPNPLAREDQAKAVRREIITGVLEEGINIDPKITADTRRIIRVPGTINSKTGYVCTVLSLSQLEKPIDQILKYIPQADPLTPLIPQTGAILRVGDERPLRGSRIISWLCHRLGARSKPHHSFSYATFLVNAVPGIDRQIPFFVYPPRRNLQKIVRELALLQDTYGLSDVFIYRSETEISAVCLRSFPLQRLEKIIAASTSQNYGLLLKYKQLFFRVGEKKDDHQQVCASAPVFIRSISAPRENNVHFVSLPHYTFFSHFGQPLPDYPRMHGEGDVFLTHVAYEE
jgi:DNA primase catalytic subunit